MEMFIIGSAIALGNYMNSDRKENDQSVKLSRNNMPSGDLIYNSNRTREIDAEMLSRAQKKHPERVRRMFPDVSENAKTNVNPTDGYSVGDIGAPINFDTTQGQQYNPSNIVPPKDPNYNAFNPETAQAFSFQTLNVDNSPMFRNQLQYSPASATYDEQSSSVSLLTGKPLDMTHTNMQPFFSSKNQQTQVSNDNSLVRLERFTGRPSIENMGTYSKKMEKTSYVNQGEPVKRAGIDQLTDRYSRAVDAVKPDNNLYKTPIKAEIVTPFDRDERRLPPGIDQTRSASNPKSVYSGVVVQGQKGSTRGMIPDSREIPKNNFIEYDTQNYTGNRSQLTTGAARANPNVREFVTGTNEYESKYKGPSVYQHRSKNIVSDKMKWKNSINNNVNRRIETFKPNIISATGNVNKGRQIGGFTVKEQQNERTLPLGQKYYSKATMDRNVNPFNNTIKDATSVNTVGAINPKSTFMTDTNYRFDQENWKRDLQVTHKELLIENKYVGQAHDNQGMGITQNTFEHYTTTKETNLHDRSKDGQVKGLTLNHMSYDSVFETGENKTKETSRLGMTKGVTSKQVKVPLPKSDFHTPMNKDYLGVGSSLITADVDRANFENSVDVYEGRPDFGNIINGGRIVDRGLDAKRMEEHQIKDDTTVDGRINPSLRRDNTTSGYLDTDVYLKESVEYVPGTQELVTKMQPLGDKRLQPQVVIKDEYEQNNRLDSTIRITNDLFPWIKK
jgi:hypothetical protein